MYLVIVTVRLQAPLRENIFGCVFGCVGVVAINSKKEGSEQQKVKEKRKK